MLLLLEVAGKDPVVLVAASSDSSKFVLVCVISKIMSVVVARTACVLKTAPIRRAEPVTVDSPLHPKFRKSPINPKS